MVWPAESVEGEWVFRAGQQQSAVVEGRDVEDAGLLHADHPCAEVD